ncbi:MAG: type II toxin-antitoxin system VapC family toxin [Dehalococcoidia bacterium]|nr:type II toxin-antitoxin system VapC family toxin [Dehalococcoidia bacterium]
MIALDTNVLVPYLVRDHAEHAEAARALFEGLTPEQPAFVCREVALEVVWVLERAYSFPRTQIANVLLELLATDSLLFEASDDVARAAWLYSQGGPGFSDRMILARAVRVEATPLYTFDRRLSRVEGAELVGVSQNGNG